MTGDGVIICSNCGFSNSAGDEFCGNCGRYLEFTGTAVAGEGQGATTGTGSVDETPAGGTPETTAWGDSPTTVQPAGTPVPTPPAGSTPYSAGTGGRAPDVICWNCGRRNPAGRAFCMQCGTKLTTQAAGGPAAAGVAYRRPDGAATDSGNAGRGMLALIAGLLVLLLVAGITGVAILGFLSAPLPTPGLIAGASPSPSAAASGSASLSATTASFGVSPAPSFTVLPTTPPTPVTITIAPPTDPLVTPRPTRSPRPTCDPSGAPRGCRPSPEPSPTIEPTITPEPTPVSCTVSAQADRSVTLTPDFPTRTIPQDFAWCVHDVTFTNTSVPGATGTLKLYLENPEYVGPPGNYGMAKIGWPGTTGACEANIATDFVSSPEFHPACAYPFGYDAITEGTIVTFEIINCGTNGTCNGTVTIEFERIAAP